MSIIDTIKDIAHSVAENYLLTNEDMNKSILAIYYEGNIENIEMLKRICELANQNVYLSLYHNEDTDRSNIKFDIVDYDKLKTEIQKGEYAMNNYLTPPTDFKTLITLVTGNTKNEISTVPSQTAKLAEFDKINSYKNTFEAFISDIESLRYHEFQKAEEAFNKLAHDAKIMVANGESLGDVAKIASRFVQEIGLNPIKIAAAYEVIYNDLKESGFNVKTEFTKVSSFRINKEAGTLKPANDFIMSIEKIAATNEMLNNLSKTLSIFKKVMNEEIKPKI